MTKKLTYTKESSEESKKERSFDLSVTALVSGIDARGENFKEKTKLSSISSQIAVLKMNNKVLLGSKLNLSLNIPKTLILEHNLNLNLSGKVTFASYHSIEKNQQLISLNLDKIFELNPILDSK